MLFITIIFHAAIALASVALFTLARADATPMKVRTPPKHGHLDKKGAVASEISACSHIGVDMIREGGNAADAVSNLSISSPVTILLSSSHL